MIRVSTIQFQFGFQGHTICQSTLQTFSDRVTGRVNVVVQELKNKIISCVSNGEVLRKDLIQAVVFTHFRRRIQLQKVAE